MKYVALQSEKYVSHTAESKAVRSYKGRVAIRALLAFFVGLALIPCAAYVGEHLNEWMPIADNWITEASGGKYQIPRLEVPVIQEIGAFFKG